MSDMKLSARKLEDQLRAEANDIWNLNQLLRAENKRLRASLVDAETDLLVAAELLANQQHDAEAWIEDNGHDVKDDENAMAVRKFLLATPEASDDTRRL